jgi:hypothetical protein
MPSIKILQSLNIAGTISANNITVNTVSALSSVNIPEVTTLQNASANWDTAYTTVTSESANWALGETLSSSGGHIGGDLRIQGDLIVNYLSALSGSSFVNTVFTTTSSLCVNSELNAGPAFFVGANGTGDIASFYDTDSNVEVLHIGGANGSFSNVGIKVSNPNKTLTVSGEISATGDAWFGTNIYSNDVNINTLYASKTATDNAVTQVTNNSAYWNTAYSQISNGNLSAVFDGFTIQSSLSTPSISANTAVFNTSISAANLSGVHYGDGGNLTNVPHYFVTARQTGSLSGSAVGDVFTAASNGSITIADGYTPVVGDIVLYTGLGVNTPNNGPWIITDVGSVSSKVVLTRPPFFRGTVKNGMLFTVLKGNTIQGITHQVYGTTASNSNIVVGSTNLSVPIVYQRASNATTASNTYTGKQTFPVGTSTLAPLAFQAGTLLTNPSAHHVEWDGTSLYHTTSAIIRKKIVAWETVVPSTTASTGVSGQFAFDANFLYVCTAANTWRRTGLSGW